MAKNYDKLFEEKIRSLESNLPDLTRGVNCAELTLMNILDVLDVKNGLLNNAMIPLAGGLGGYKSKEGWQGACGAVCGGCAAIGIILGGKERMKDNLIPLAYLKAAKFASEFEKEFGTVVCAQLCGYDFSEADAFMMYQKENQWSKMCYKYVIWAVGKIQKIMSKELKQYW